MNVLITTRQRPELLSRTLASLEQARPPIGSWRVFVVENGGPKTSEEICARSSLPIRYHFLEAAGKSRALNFGLNFIRHGLVVFLDDDVRVSRDLLRAYWDAADRHGSEKIYGGPVIPDYETSPPPDWLEPFLPPSVRGFFPEPGQLFLGGNFGAFVEPILEVGGFDPDLGGGAREDLPDSDPVAEETELQKRLLDNHLTLLPLPDARVWHFIPSERCNPRWTLDRAYRHGLSEGILWARNKPGPGLFGAPRWVWRSLVQSRFLGFVNLLFRRRERAFGHFFKSHHARGLIQGALRGPRKG